MKQKLDTIRGDEYYHNYSYYTVTNGNSRKVVVIKNIETNKVINFTRESLLLAILQCKDEREKLILKNGLYFL